MTEDEFSTVFDYVNTQRQIERSQEAIEYLEEEIGKSRNRIYDMRAKIIACERALAAAPAPDEGTAEQMRAFFDTFWFRVVSWEERAYAETDGPGWADFHVKRPPAFEEWPCLPLYPDGEEPYSFSGYADSPNKLGKHILLGRPTSVHCTWFDKAAWREEERDFVVRMELVPRQEAVEAWERYEAERAQRLRAEKEGKDEHQI
jgi:hypothetical protein